MDHCGVYDTRHSACVVSQLKDTHVKREYLDSFQDSSLLAEEPCHAIVARVVLL